MHGASESALLQLWEDGRPRHPIDRALLLCACARPELDAGQLARLPLGALNATLLRLHAAWFGPAIVLQLDCAQCGERLETQMHSDDLLAGAPGADAPATVEVHGIVLRLPDSRDLAAIAHETDTDAAALQLLTRCRIGAPDGPADDLQALMAQAEDGLEAADPLADMRLDVACHACGHHTQALFDPCTMLWTGIERRARSVLEQVHTLAQAYGWTEGEVLALSPARRAAYLELAGG